MWEQKEKCVKKKIFSTHFDKIFYNSPLSCKYMDKKIVKLLKYSLSLLCLHNFSGIILSEI